MSRGKAIKRMPDEIQKAIIDLSGRMSSREISKAIKITFDYTISHVAVNNFVKEIRQERAEIVKDKFTTDIEKNLPQDLEILNKIINDLYEDYSDLNVDELAMKCKTGKTIASIMDIKFKNMGIQEPSNVQVNWEKYLDENEGEDYLW